MTTDQIQQQSNHAADIKDAFNRLVDFHFPQLTSDTGLPASHGRTNVESLENGSLVLTFSLAHDEDGRTLEDSCRFLTQCKKLGFDAEGYVLDKNGNRAKEEEADYSGSRYEVRLSNTADSVGLLNRALEASAHSEAQRAIERALSEVTAIQYRANKNLPEGNIIGLQDIIGKLQAMATPFQGFTAALAAARSGKAVTQIS